MEEDINQESEPTENENVDTTSSSRPPNAKNVMLQAFLSDKQDDDDNASQGGEAGEEEDEDDEMQG